MKVKRGKYICQLKLREITNKTILGKSGQVFSLAFIKEQLLSCSIAGVFQLLFFDIYMEVNWL